MGPWRHKDTKAVRGSVNKSTCKNEALSSDPSTQVKGVLGHVHGCAQCCVGGDEDYWSCWLSVSHRFSGRPCLRGTWRVVEQPSSVFMSMHRAHVIHATLTQIRTKPRKYGDFISIVRRQKKAYRSYWISLTFKSSTTCINT